MLSMFVKTNKQVHMHLCIQFLPFFVNRSIYRFKSWIPYNLRKEQCHKYKDLEEKVHIT